MKTDFHIHSLHSDGVLSGAEIIALARQRNVKQLSITDHDSVSVYAELSEKIPPDIEIIPGCEFSCVWQARTIHVVGLNLDLSSSTLSKAMEHQSDARTIRAEAIANELAKKGLADALEGARHVAMGSVLGRPHFAQFMVDQGFVKDHKQAFKKYLGKGKVGDIKAQWPELAQVCDWIRQSGGVPVLAHPLKYAMTQTKLKALLTDFRDAGGQAMEVISGKQQSAQTNLMTRLCDDFGLYASLGSDFHQPGQHWADLGMIPDLPVRCVPVWQSWQ